MIHEWRYWHQLGLPATRWDVPSRNRISRVESRWPSRCTLPKRCRGQLDVGIFAAWSTVYQRKIQLYSTSSSKTQKMLWFLLNTWTRLAFHHFRIGRFGSKIGSEWLKVAFKKDPSLVKNHVNLDICSPPFFSEICWDDLRAFLGVWPSTSHVCQTHSSGSTAVRRCGWRRVRVDVAAACCLRWPAGWGAKFRRCSDGPGLSHGGTPIYGWFISWKIPPKNGWWFRFRGTPHDLKNGWWFTMEHTIFFLMDDLGQETSIRGGYTYYMLLTKP